MPKVKAKAWSVAGNKILEKRREGMPPEQIAAIEEEANHRALVDVFGEGFRRERHPARTRPGQR